MANKNQPDDQTTHRQHWLPRTSYLQEFAIDDLIQVYRYEPGEKANFIAGKHFATGPNAVANERDLYETPELPVNTFEKALAEIEGQYGTVLNEKIKKLLDLTPEEHQVVASYVEALQHRTPAQRTHLDGQIDQVVRMGRQIAVAHGSPEAGDRFAAEFDEVRKTTFTDALGIALSVNPWRNLDFCFLVIESSLDSMNFVTSDNPVSLVDFTRANSFYGLHPLHETAESVVPLTSKIALFGNNLGITGYRRVDANLIREVNHRTVLMGRDTVFSPVEIDEREMNAIIKRFPQSLILSYLDLASPEEETE